MKRILSSLFVFYLLLFVCGRVFSMNEYKTEDEEAAAYNVTRTTKTVEGLNFRVEPDRPIEKVAGVYRPIDLDSYIALKFNKLEKKLDALTSQLTQRIEELSARVEALEKKVQSPRERIERIQNETQQNATQQILP